MVIFVLFRIFFFTVLIYSTKPHIHTFQPKFFTAQTNLLDVIHCYFPLSGTLQIMLLFVNNCLNMLTLMHQDIKKNLD